MKSDKIPYISYADMECLTRNINGYGSNSENSSTKKKQVSIILVAIQCKHTLYRGKDCMKNRCTSLKDYVKNIIDSEIKKTLGLTKEELKSCQDAKVCCICWKRILKNTKVKNYQKAGDHCHYTGKYRGAAHSVCNLKFNMPNKNPVVFPNGSIYDYYLIIKEVANEFEG